MLPAVLRSCAERSLRELLDLQPLLDLLPTNLWDEFGNVLVRRDLCPDV